MKLPHMPKFRMPQLIKKRPDGTTEFWKLSGREWFFTLFALIVLWIVMAGIFTGLLSAATAIRDRGALYAPRPGAEICLFGEPGCDRVNPVKAVASS